MSQQVVIIDYGSGNLHSVKKAVERAGSSYVVISSDPSVIESADRVILPGVGAMGACMQELKDRNLDKVLSNCIGQRKPLMGVCVGMQILAEYGEESSGVDALGVFPGQITQFSKSMIGPNAEPLKVPHMGWNHVKQLAHPMWRGITDQTRFYFVHSYRYADVNKSYVFGTCEYGVPFAAALAKKDVFAVQFHPEKSHDAGIQLYRNFLTWDGTC